MSVCDAVFHLSTILLGELLSCKLGVRDLAPERVLARNLSMAGALGCCDCCGFRGEDSGPLMGPLLLAFLTDAVELPLPVASPSAPEPETRTSILRIPLLSQVHCHMVYTPYPNAIPSNVQDDVLHYYEFQVFILSHFSYLHGYGWKLETI